LEAAIDAAQQKEKTWDFSQIPQWVKAAGAYYLLGITDSWERTPIPRPEVELARKAIHSIHGSLAAAERRSSAREKIDGLLKSPDLNGIREIDRRQLDLRPGDN
jgi:hypothetical protein